MRRNRKGAALIELAVFIPILFVISIATLETCRMIYLRQSLKIAAYECARLAIVPGVTAEDIQAQCDAVLLGRKIDEYTLTCTPADPQQLRVGELFKAEVEAPATEAAIVASWFYSGSSLKEHVVIMAEY